MRPLPDLLIEALQVDFFDDCRDVRTFRCEIDFLDSSVDYAVDFGGQAALPTVRTSVAPMLDKSSEI
jgi:hypothetical protein